MWSALAVALLLLATAESAAIVALALVIRDLERELERRDAAEELPPAPEPAPPTPRRPVGFRPPG